ncbi:hypothetical protein ACFYSF_22770 [Streptomyces canus]|uniref:hypothetical protein n=1 Tax=Streptomyces canus TaxID=58343 RepID=UPI003694E50B
MTDSMDLSSKNTVREFLRLCLDPGHGVKRTPAQLAEVMPGALRDAVTRFAPHLAELLDEATRKEKEARRARRAYVDAFSAWINADDDADNELVLCQQNRRGDDAVPQPHFYAPDTMLCVFCGEAAHWDGGESPIALRTPDGREWTRAVEANENGVPLYEAPFVGTRFTALALETMHGRIEAVAPAYVFNADSVNRSTKHIPNALGNTMCPSGFRASTPMPQEEAARLALCGGCRRALLANLLDVEAEPACPGAAIDHDETGICTHA